MTTETKTEVITTPVRARPPEDAQRMESVEVQPRNPGEMMVLAIQHNADPAVLGKLLDLQERYEAAQSRKAYVEAMTEFKRECPAVLNRDATVDFKTNSGRTTYRHATLGGIVHAITPLLSKNGLSVSFETSQDKERVSVTCNITHRAGHRESTTLIGPQDTSGNKNLIQAVGSAVTYLQRYTLLSALGLATADQDDDGFGADMQNRSGKPSVAAGILDKKKAEAAPQSAPQSAPPPHDEGNQVPAGTEVVTGKIEKVVKTPGEKRDGTKWVRYGVTIAGVTYGTFSETHGTAAMDAHEANAEVDIEWVQDGKYKNLVGIRLTNEPIPVDRPPASEDNSDLFPNE